jgi:chemotaxis receptor (MCP) glutamine deamidase CheD
MAEERLYASKGMVRVLSAPGVLKAVVGPGYAVCVRTAEASVGGIAHVGIDAAPERDKLGLFVGELVDGLVEAGGSLRGTVAEIVGGADVLRLFPRDVHAARLREHVEALTAELATRKIEARASRVGGNAARVVELFLPEGDLEVRWVSRKRRRQGARRNRVRPEPEADTPVPPPIPDRVVNMGCLEVASSPVRLTAVLGSCVGIALCDPTTGIGGLAHAMMPVHNGDPGPAAKYVDTAVPALIEALVLAGARRGKLEAKVVGGANVLSIEPTGLFQGIGVGNIDVARSALAAAGVPLAWEDVGGRIARKMHLELPSFRIDVRQLPRLGDTT